MRETLLESRNLGISRSTVDGQLSTLAYVRTNSCISLTHLLLNLLIAFLVNSLNTNLPLMAARSCRRESQCSAPFQKMVFNSRMASGLECASTSFSLEMDSSMPSIVG